jgi:beta-phosphoglucomutase family hydrolase
VNPSYTPVDPGLAFLFDMDGVIIDSNPLHCQAWIAFNRRYGLETTEAMLASMYGKRNDEIVRTYFGADLAAEEIVARGAAKEALYREMLHGRLEATLVPGVRAFLEEYRSVPKGLASNAEPANVELIVEEAGIRPCFRVIVDGHQVQNPKPDPEIYLKVAQILGIAPANCIVFEDSETGVQAGLAAGMRVVGFRTTHGYLPGTDISVDNFESRDLRPWLAMQKAVER